MHADLKEGDRVKISLPRNHFPLRPASRSLLFAGGIGITPMLSMAEHLTHVGADFSLHYCARSRDRMPFIDRIRTSRFSDKAFLHFDDADPQQRLDLATTISEAHDDARLYVCGPQGFMDWIIGAAKAQGWPSDRIHFEAFGGSLNFAAGGHAFEVVLKRTGRVYAVPPEKSVASVLTEAGVDVPLSCEAGMCGTCVLPVLEGTPDHRDSFLTDEERARNDRFTPCCSRAHGAQLVIDL
jgi:vanillate O-demethylase ferredoxin subunit